VARLFLQEIFRKLESFGPFFTEGKSKEELHYKQLLLCMTEQDIWKQNTEELDFFPEKTWCVVRLCLYFCSVSTQDHITLSWLRSHTVSKKINKAQTSKQSFKWDCFTPVRPNVEAPDNSRKPSCVQILMCLHLQIGLQVPVNEKYIKI